MSQAAGSVVEFRERRHEYAIETSRNAGFMDYTKACMVTFV